MFPGHSETGKVGGRAPRAEEIRVVRKSDAEKRRAA